MSRWTEVTIMMSCMSSSHIWTPLFIYDLSVCVSWAGWHVELFHHACQMCGAFSSRTSSSQSSHVTSSTTSQNHSYHAVRTTGSMKNQLHEWRDLNGVRQRVVTNEWKQCSLSFHSLFAIDRSRTYHQKGKNGKTVEPHRKRPKPNTIDHEHNAPKSSEKLGESNKRVQKNMSWQRLITQ